ncbi:MAG TPA: hypothetical protein VF771_16140 [Longimicrobiaceae bacterium]
MFEPIGFIHLGHALAHEAERAREQSRAARVRAAYGRLYYGLFLIVRDALVSRHRVASREVRHGALSDHLQHSNLADEVRSLGREMQRLYALRQKADYELAPRAPWDKQLVDVGLAQLLSRRALEFANSVQHFDFTPIIHLFDPRRLTGGGPEGELQ